MKLPFRKSFIFIFGVFALCATMIAMLWLSLSYANEQEQLPAGQEKTTNNITETFIVTDDEGLVEGARVNLFNQQGQKVVDRFSTDDQGIATTSLGDEYIGQKLLLSIDAYDQDCAVYFDTFVVSENNGQHNITLTRKANMIIKVPESQGQDPQTVHDHFEFTVSIDGFTIKQNVPKPESGEISFNPFIQADGEIYMTDTARLMYVYKNNSDKEISVKIDGKGTQWYKSYYWGMQTDKEPGTEMIINHKYPISEASNYTFGVFYKGLTMLNFSSNSECHDLFDVAYVKNGQPYVSLQDQSFKNTTFEGAECSVTEDGKIRIYFNDTDPDQPYCVDGFITAMPKDGYKVDGWLLNGQLLNSGDTRIAQLADTMNFEPNYVNESMQSDDTKTAQTGDFTFAVIAILSVISVCSLLGLVNRKRSLS